MKFYLRVTEGEYDGNIVPKVLWLHTESGHTQFVKEMRRIGFDVNSLDDLERNEAVIIGLTIVIQVCRQQNKVPQVYFLRRA